ncbi:hypothetical protein JTB14_015812 [Gonioctena quinquepunctata]|nr:hypothetical protein JTB14_015812 [Gonioctena quinquepunctata]
MREVYRTSLTTTEKDRTPFWWTPDIGVKRQECLSLRREATRMNKRTPRNEEELNEARDDLRRCRKELRFLNNQSRKKHWDDLCRELEDDIWGTGYKIATKKLVGHTPFNIAVEQKIKVANDLFPRKKKSWKISRTGGAGEPFTAEELKNVLEKMKPGKAPGLDGIPMEAIKKLEEIAPETILEPLNDILTKRNFPKDWKQAKLVLIPKGNAENMKLDHMPSELHQ